MKNVKIFIAVTAAAAILAACAGAPVIDTSKGQSPTKQGAYVWKSVAFGGGGFVDGIIYHPAEKDLVYLRTDMGGAYIWDKKAKRWENITDMFGRDKADVPGILSLALDPNDTNRVYMMTGKYTQDWAGKGVFLISKDRGKTYKEVPLEFKVGGNENGRGAGERVAVDPNKGSILFMGSTKDGLWKTADHGETWTKVTAFPASGINYVFFDKMSGSKGGATKRIFVSASENGKSIYVSEDAGATWSLVPGAPKELQGLRIDSAGDELYMTFSDFHGPNDAHEGLVFKYNISAKTWTKLNLPQEGSGGFSGISVDARNPLHIVVSTLDNWSLPDDIYRSVDGGKSWTRKIKGAEFDRTDAGYTKHSTPHWIADVKIDPFDSNKVMWVTGYGLWATKNFSSKNCTWYFNNKNMEQTVCLQTVSPESGETQLVTALGDQDGYRHGPDMDKAPPDKHIPPRWTTRAVAVAAKDPMKMVKICDKPPYGSISVDNGINWVDFREKPKGAKYGGGTRSIALSADGRTIVWGPDKAPVCYSNDDGASWKDSGGGIPQGLRPLADTTNPRKFYAYDANTGHMWVSDNGGESFSGKNGECGFVQKWTVDDCMAAVAPGYENHLWVTADTKGLYRTSDGGDNVIKVQNVEEAYRIGFGMAAPGNSYPAVFLTGKVGGVSGFYRSDDAGTTWVRINDDLHQYGWIHTIIGDPRIYGRCYVSPEGRGVVYGDFQ